MYWSHWQTDKVQGPSKHSSFKLSSKSLVFVFSSQKCFFVSSPSSPGKGPGSSRPFTTVHPQQQRSRWHLVAAGPHRLFHRERHPMRVGTRMRARVFGGLGRLKPPPPSTGLGTEIDLLLWRLPLQSVDNRTGYKKDKNYQTRKNIIFCFSKKSSDFVLNSL